MPQAFGVRAIADRVRGLQGWRRGAAAMAAGVVSNLALAPAFVWPVLWLTLPVLVWLAEGAVAHSDRAAVTSITSNQRAGWRHWAGALPRALARTPAGRAGVVGWWFGFGYFLVGLFWIGEAFLVEADVYGWLLPFAVTGLPAGLAIFFGLALAAVAALPNVWHHPVARLLAIAAAISVAEWLRGHILTGFPWNVLGYALTAPGAFLAASGLMGIYALTLACVLIFTGPLMLLAEPSWRSGPNLSRVRIAAAALAVLPLALLALYGRLHAQTPLTGSGLTVRLVQPSIPQREKWRPENQIRIFEEHLALSRQRADGTIDDLAGVDLVVWPEAAMPFLPLETPQALDAIDQLLPSQTILLTGAIRRDAALPSGDGSRRVYNSLLAFGTGGGLRAAYDKVHLVPFGEYLPAQTVLEAIGLRQLTRVRGGFASGPMPRPNLEIPTRLGPILVGPLICYEAIFPASAIQSAARPRLMVNVTNDGWFGNTTGPRQHFHQTRVRAVEEGTTIVRVANNGISAVIDPLGGIGAMLALDKKGSADAQISNPIPPPPYARYGDWIFVVFLLSALAIVARLGRTDFTHRL